MASTTNYSWSTPDNSGLVKNGAQDIRTLGSAIDTSLWNVGFGQAGKNKIINGNFGVWQRGTSFSAYGYWADRWTGTGDRTSPSFTRQTFTPASAPVAGYEGEYYARWVPGLSGSFSNIQQRIEDVRTFANQSVTLSYWARISTGTATNSPYIIQNFGSGGSAEVSTALSTNTITTTWTRFTHSFTVPSISGKTVGTSSYLAILPLRFETASTANVDVWGVQLEAGSVATAFQTATGTIQGELAACQRYYEKSYDLATAPATATETGSFGFCVGTNSSSANYFTYAPIFKVQKRGTPTITLYDLNGNSGKVNKVSAVDLSMTANQTATADRIGETEFRIYSALGTAGGFYGHYVASAEL